MWRQGAAVKCTGTGNSSEPESPSRSVVRGGLRVGSGCWRSARLKIRAAGTRPDLISVNVAA